MLNFLLKCFSKYFRGGTEIPGTATVKGDGGDYSRSELVLTANRTDNGVDYRSEMNHLLHSTILLVLYKTTHLLCILTNKWVLCTFLGQRSTFWWFQIFFCKNKKKKKCTERENYNRKSLPVFSQYL